MRKSLTATAIAALVAAVLVGVAAPGADAGIIGGQPDAKIKGPGMSFFIGSDLYWHEPIPQQTLEHTLPENGTATFKVKVQNDRITGDRFRFGGFVAGTQGLKVQFYKGDRRITQQMYAQTYWSPKVKPDASHTVKFVVKDRGAPIGSSSLEIAVFAQSKGNPESIDSVGTLITH